MSDPVTLIAEVLKKHDRWRHCWWKCDGGTAWNEAQHRDHVAAVVATRLAEQSLLVELPEPYPDETVYPYWSVEDVNGPQVVGVEEPGVVSIQFTARWRTVDVPTARALGAAFLAAANAAEGIARV